MNPEERTAGKVLRRFFFFFKLWESLPKGSGVRLTT